MRTVLVLADVVAHRHDQNILFYLFTIVLTRQNVKNAAYYVTAVLELKITNDNKTKQKHRLETVILN